MIQSLISILGEYSPPSYEVWNETLQDFETVIPSGSAGVDWSFVLSAVLIIVVIYAFLRALGGIFRR